MARRPWPALFEEWCKQTLLLVCHDAYGDDGDDDDDDDDDDHSCCYHYCCHERHMESLLPRLFSFLATVRL